MAFLRKYRNVLGAAAILFAIAAVLFAAYWQNRTVPEFIPYITFMEAAAKGRIASVQLSDGATVRFTFTDSDHVYTTSNPRRDDFIETLLLAGAAVEETGAGVDYAALGITVVLVGGVIFIVQKRTKAMAAANGLAPVARNTGEENEEKTCGFNDIAGNLEAKESVADIVAYLREPEKFTRCGARMPRGILLHGKPGTGKTLMARAMAGEAGVPFYAVSGSDFVQMYVGVGAARVRDLFKKAREQKCCVIFIDEIDALGKKRGDGINGNDEREQTLNALLTEMQGFSDESGIVVVAATNRPDTLDEALLRPGRFDRRVEVGLPDMPARKQILALHARNKPLSPDIDLDKLARDTVFFSGAMLEGLLNDAAINAARRDNDIIEETDISTAYYTAIAGAEKKDRSALREQERAVTAWHESGHALAALLTNAENRVAKVTIIPSGAGAGGFCINIPPERMYYTKQELEQQIMVNFAGRCAEELRFGEGHITTGASNDLEKATELAWQYTTRYGFSSEILNREKMGGKKAAAKECSKLAKRLYAETMQLLQDNYTALAALAEKLLEKETLSGEEVAELVMR